MAPDNEPHTDPTDLAQEPFGQTSLRVRVHRYRLVNRNGMQTRVATFGGVVTHLTAPDRHGEFADVVLGYDDLDSYLADTYYLGALIGRYANRIRGGSLVVDGDHHQLSTNESGNTLHGGPAGFDKMVWQVIDASVTDSGPRLTLQHQSLDGEGGFPGTLDVTAIYTLTHQNELRLDLHATTDKPTVVNRTQHSYFNLRGSGAALLSHDATYDSPNN